MAAARGRRAAAAVATLGVVALSLTLAAGSAHASSNNGPTTAAPVNVGVPFSGNWPGTVLAHGSDFNHWWRLPTTVRAGDSLQLAVDNRLGARTVYFCLVAPVDSFGADQAIGRCEGDDWVSSGRQDRVDMTYADSSGQTYLIVYTSSCCPGVGAEADPDEGQYAVTIERIVTRVNPGLVVPVTIPATFTVASSMVYGDNAPVADGVGARLEWRYQPERGRTPSPYTPLVDTYSVGGTATFDASLPREAQGRAIQLRACASQPGGDTAVCTADQKTSVQAGGPSPACLTARGLRRAQSQAVARLKSKVRRLEVTRTVVRGKAKRRATRQLRRSKRKLATAKRQLTVAKRNARAVC